MFSIGGGQAGIILGCDVIRIIVNYYICQAANMCARSQLLVVLLICFADFVYELGFGAPAALSWFLLKILHIWPIGVPQRAYAQVRYTQFFVQHVQFLQLKLLFYFLQIAFNVQLG